MVTGSGAVRTDGGPARDLREGKLVTTTAVNDLRQLRTMVVHPRDRDGDLLIRHLQRLGCSVEVVWPAPSELPTDLDAVFCLIGSIGPQPRAGLAWPANDPRCAIVAIVERESPGALRALTDCNPQAVLWKPIEPFGILTSLTLARNILGYERRLLAKVAKLEETLRSIRKVERAKAILMKNKNIEEEEAYRYLRTQAMMKRVPIGVIASAIIDAKEMLT